MSRPALVIRAGTPLWTVIARVDPRTLVEQPVMIAQKVAGQLRKRGHFTVN
jgi:hypothetical protein